MDRLPGLPNLPRKTRAAGGVVLGLAGAQLSCARVCALACLFAWSGAAFAQSATTTTTLAVTSGGSAVTTVTSGSVVTLTATVLAGTTPVTVGQVNFCNAAATNCIGLNLLATAQLTSAGTATYKFRPGVGSHSYNAVFLGTPNGATAYAGSTSSAAALSVTGLSPSITTLAVSPGTSSNTYDFRATVGGNGSTAPTGTVSFLDSGNGNAVLGTATLGDGTAGVSFLNTSNPGVSHTFGQVAVGDFNGDGIPDLAVVTASNGFVFNIVTILLGDGDGTFTATPTSPSMGPSPFAMAVADFNGDGILDLAVTDFDGTVTVLLGNGDGTFTPVAASPAVGVQPESIAVGDFNGDGIPDLAVANYCGSDPNCNSDGTVTMLLGNGDGTFRATATSPATGAEPLSIGVDDFNGDGIPDLAVGNYHDGTVTILLGNGDGTFAHATAVPTGVNPTSIAVGDFNGDGILDLAVADYQGGSVTILLGNGDGTFTSKGNLTTGANAFSNFPNSIVTGDFNGDGIADLAVTSEGGQEVSLFLGVGAGNFTPAISSYVEYPVAFAVGDFNGDGVSDLAVSSGNFSQYLTILEAANQTATAAINGVAPAGTNNQLVDASYPGDLNYSVSTSVATPLEPRLAPTVTVTPSSSSIPTTQALTVGVTVSGPPGYPTPTGSVVLAGGDYNYGPITLSSGSAQITIPAGTLATGPNNLPVIYTPDSASFAFYTSANIAGAVTVIQPVTPTLTVTPLATSILNTQTLQINISVSGPSGDPTPTGSATLTGGGYTSAATALSGGTAQINIPAGSLAFGSDTLTAIYTPDSGSPGYTSASGTSTVAVSSFTPTVTVTPLATSILTTQALQVDLSVSGPSGDPTPTGSVDLTSGSYDSGAITLSSGSAAINVPGNSLGAGTDTLSVSYVPDSASSATYSSAAGSSPVTVTAPNASPTVGSMSPAFQTAGDDAFTLTVNGAGFISGSTVYWGTTALTTQFVSAAQITALVPASEIASSGTDSITVESPMPGGGTSNTLQFEVDSSGSGSPSLTTNKATVTAGQSATYAITLPSAPTAVTASCLNLPTGASCSYSSTTSTMTIATSTTTPAGTYQVTMVFTETVAGAASAFIFLPILMLPLVRARRKWTAGKIWFTACLGLVLLVASAGIGCGGGGTSSTQPPPSTHQITTSAVVTLTVQ